MEGNKLCRSDLVFHLTDSLVLVLEYDGLVWHMDAQRDMRKINRLLRADPRVHILRLRAPEAPALPLDTLPEEDRARVRIATAGRCAHMGKALLAVAESVAEWLPAPLATRLRQVQTAHRRPMADVVATEVHQVINERECRYFQALQTAIGADLAESLVRVHGVRTRLWTGELVEGVARLKTMGMRNDDIRTFMCGGVAAHFGKEWFWEGIARLEGMGMHKDDLRTFMCGGVAAHFGKEWFWEGIARLENMGMHKDDLCTFMCDGVAAHFGKEWFWEGIDVLSSIDRGKLTTMMCGGIAARLDRSYAERILAIVNMLDEFGIDGAARVKTLFNRTPLCPYASQIQEELCATSSRTEAEAFLSNFRNPYGRMKAAALRMFGKPRDKIKDAVCRNVATTG